MSEERKPFESDIERIENRNKKWMEIQKEPHGRTLMRLKLIFGFSEREEKE
ncbi:hypothetical protein KAU51_01790 [Candidatus Parcubacteria bacterium]|nr:hypothetical protein [Candidatus Parcubacteria bacterium]